MVNKSIERDLVLQPCLRLCRKLRDVGYILKYRRLDALDYYHERGDPDIEIWIPVDKHVFILMAECKKPEGGIVSKHQIECREKYKQYTNVMYEIITDFKQLKKLILELSNPYNPMEEEFLNEN